MKLLVLSIALLLFTACSEEEKSNVFFNDYEQSFGWQTVPVVRGNTHSGVYAEAIDPGREFSTTFQSTFAQIEPAYPLPQIKASVWLYATKLTQPVLLVLQVSDPADGRSIEYKSIEVKPADVNGKWYNALFIHRLPIELKGSYLCKVFLWNPNKQNLLADDFQVAFEK